MNLRRLAPDYYVADQLHPEDMTALADLGIRAVINHRPDGESDDQPGRDALAAAAAAAGIDYREAPVSTLEVSETELTRTRDALQALDGPVCAFCRSGGRAALCWAYVQLGGSCTQSIVDAVVGAGFDQLGIEERLGRRLLAQQRPEQA